MDDLGRGTVAKFWHWDVDELHLLLLQDLNPLLQLQQLLVRQLFHLSNQNNQSATAAAPITPA